MPRYQNYDEVPWYRRATYQTVFVLLMALGLPLVLFTIVVWFTGDIYYDTRDSAGNLRVWDRPYKTPAIVFAILALLLIAAYLLAPDIFMAVLSL